MVDGDDDGMGDLVGGVLLFETWNIAHGMARLRQPITRLGREWVSGVDG